MIGVIVNTIAVIIGSLAGLLFRKGIPQKYKDAIMQAIGLCTIYIGVQGLMQGQNALVAIISMVVGVALGTGFDLDGKVNGVGEAVQAKFAKSGGESTVAQGMVTAFLLWCVGAMTIVGSLQAGITGDCQTLYTKSILDLISSMMLASSLGIGVLLSAGTVFIIQGGLVLLAGVIAPFMNAGAINEMTCAGSLLIVMIGTNLMGITKIKVADYLPAILFAPILYNIIALF